MAKYYCRLKKTGHIWLITSGDASHILDNTSLIGIKSSPSNFDQHNQGIKDYFKNEEFSLSEAIQGKIDRKYPIRIVNDYDNLSLDDSQFNIPLSITKSNDSGVQELLSSFDKDGNFYIKSNFSGNTIDILSANIANDLLVNNSLTISGNALFFDNMYDKDSNEIYGFCFHDLSSLSNSYYNDNYKKIYSRNIETGYYNENIDLDGIWTIAPSFNAASRIYLSSTTLNGYGYAIGGSSLNTVEKYNDNIGNWNILSNMNNIKSDHCSFNINSYIYAAGGVISSETNIVEKYNDISNTWSSIATLNTARSGLSGFSLNNYGYTVGGKISDISINIVEKYNDISNTWSSIATLNTARSSQMSFTLNGYGYIAGGSTSDSYNNEALQYNNSLDIWFNIVTLNAGKQNGAGFYNNGYGYIAGGAISGGVKKNTVEKYNNLLKLFINISTLNESKAFLSGCQINGYGYVIGGYTVSTYGLTEKHFISYKYIDLGILGTSKNIAKNILASHSCETTLSFDKELNVFDSILFQYRTNLSGDWANGYTNNIFFGISGNPNPINDLYEYEFKVLLPEICNYDNDIWTTIASLNTARTTSGFLLNGYGYTVGGGIGTSPIYMDVVEKYNDILNTWLNVAILNTERRNGDCFSLNEYGYITGGDNGSDSDLDTTEKYNDISNAWSNVATLSTARTRLSGFSLNEYGYITGGDNGSILGITEKYNDISNAWSNMKSLTTVRENAASFSLNKYGYIFGGLGDGGALDHLNNVEKYNDVLNFWSDITILNVARSSIAGFSLNNYGYSTCGYNGSFLGITEKYNDISNFWYNTTTLNTARALPAAFSLNEYGYVAGGVSGSYLDTTEKINGNFLSKITGFSIKIIE